MDPRLKIERASFVSRNSSWMHFSSSPLSYSFPRESPSFYSSGVFVYICVCWSYAHIIFFFFHLFSILFSFLSLLGYHLQVKARTNQTYASHPLKAVWHQKTFTYTYINTYSMFGDACINIINSSPNRILFYKNCESTLLPFLK